MLNISEDVTFQMQSGLIRDTITVDVSELNLNSLKNLACNFIDTKVVSISYNCVIKHLALTAFFSASSIPIMGLIGFERDSYFLSMTTIWKTF